MMRRVLLLLMMMLLLRHDGRIGVIKRILVKIRINVELVVGTRDSTVDGWHIG